MIYLPHLQATAFEMLVSFILAVIFSLGLACLMKCYPWVHKAIMPCFVLLQNLPMFVLAPLLLSCFGWGLLSILVPTVLMLAFPLTLAFLKGLEAAPKDYLYFYQSHGASVIQTFIQVRLPFALPHIFSGLKIAAASSATGALAGEWAGAQKGLGVLIQIFRREFDVEGICVCLACVALLSLLFYLMVAALEYCLLRGVGGVKKQFVCIGLLSLFFTGCHQTSSRPCRLLLDWLPNANHLPLVVAQNEGIFAKHGLDIQLIYLQDPPSTISYLKTDHADGALYYFPSFIKVCARSSEFSMIGKLFDEPLFCLFTKNANQIEQLGSRTIGTYGDLFSKALLNSLHQQNITFSKTLYSHCDLAHLFYFNQIEVGSGSINVEALQLEKKLGPLSIFSWKDLKIPRHPEIVVIAKNSYLGANPFFAKAFQKALQESIDFCKKHPDQALDHYFSMFPEKKRSKDWEKVSCLKTIDLLALSQELDTKEVDAFLEWIHQHGKWDLPKKNKELLEKSCQLNTSTIIE